MLFRNGILKKSFTQLSGTSVTQSHYSNDGRLYSTRQNVRLVFQISLSCTAYNVVLLSKGRLAPEPSLKQPQRRIHGLPNVHHIVVHTCTRRLLNSTADSSLPTPPVTDEVPILKLLQLATACTAGATGQTGERADRLSYFHPPPHDGSRAPQSRGL